MKDVVAKPRSIRFSEEKGYRLSIKITDGPQNMVDRLVNVELTAEQINKIIEWDETTVPRLDLET
jgi:hypothetical protein